MKVLSVKDEVFKDLEVPSVSRILKEVFGDAEFKDIPKQVLEMAQDRGKAVHKVIEDYILEDTPLTIELEYQAYIDHFKEWEKKYDPTFYGYAEIKVGSNELGYKGIIDVIFEQDKKVVICDWKTSSNLNVFKASMQLSLYAMALEEQGIIIDEIRVLSLTKKGYKYIEIPYKKEVAKALLELYKFKKEVGK